MLTDRIFYLFIEVMKACQEGRFQHGNGAQWCIVDQLSGDVVIDTCEGSVRCVNTPDQLPAHTDMGTYNTLRSFLLQSKMQDNVTTTYTYGYAYRSTMDALVQACKNQEVLFTNGAQWYVRHSNHPGLVFVYDITVRGQVAVTQMSGGNSWKYMQDNTVRQSIDDATILYLSRL